MGSPPSAIIIGGSSGMGKAAAKEFVACGGSVLLCSRSLEKLKSAAEFVGGLPGQVETRQLDNTSEPQVKAFFESLAPDKYSALIVTALGRAVHGPFLGLEVEKARELFEGKLWGPWYCAKHGAPKLRDGGAIVLVSGVLCRRPGANCTPLGSANGAVEALTRNLALELGPRLRVNCLSPGFVDTERFDHMPPERREAMLEATADSLPLKRVGRPQDAGQALHFLATNSFTTGVVLDVDGGHQVRQYAMPNDLYVRLKREREASAGEDPDRGRGPRARAE